MDKFSPGPWRYEKLKGNAERRIFSADSSAEKDWEALMGDTPYYPWCPEKEEDWQLIAAAPELLQALRDLLSPDTNVEDSVKRAEAAIRKATK